MGGLGETLPDPRPSTNGQDFDCELRTAGPRAYSEKRLTRLVRERREGTGPKRRVKGDFVPNAAPLLRRISDLRAV